MYVCVDCTELGLAWLGLHLSDRPRYEILLVSVCVPQTSTDLLVCTCFDLLQSPYNTSTCINSSSPDRPYSPSSSSCAGHPPRSLLLPPPTPLIMSRPSHQMPLPLLLQGKNPRQPRPSEAFREVFRSVRETSFQEFGGKPSRQWRKHGRRNPRQRPSEAFLQVSTRNRPETLYHKYGLGASCITLVRTILPSKPLLHICS